MHVIVGKEQDGTISVFGPIDNAELAEAAQDRFDQSHWALDVVEISPLPDSAAASVVTAPEQDSNENDAPPAEATV